jgi:cytochrome c biogenesis protein CcdA
VSRSTARPLLLVGGVMNVFWIALLALLILLKKVTPFGRHIASLAGIVLVAAGAWMQQHRARAFQQITLHACGFEQGPRWIFRRMKAPGERDF